MKRISLLILLLCSHFSAAALASQTDDVLRAGKENQTKLVQTIRQLKAEKEESLFSKISNVGYSRRDHCDDDDRKEPVTCVRKCIQRGASGTCYQYGEDYCAENASCVEQCIQRGASGTCYQYGADYCGAFVSCQEHCIERGASGTCYQYGPDLCY